MRSEVRDCVVVPLLAIVRFDPAQDETTMNLCVCVCVCVRVCGDRR